MNACRSVLFAVAFLFCLAGSSLAESDFHSPIGDVDERICAGYETIIVDALYEVAALELLIENTGRRTQSLGMLVGRYGGNAYEPIGDLEPGQDVIYELAEKESRGGPHSTGEERRRHLIPSLKGQFGLISIFGRDVSDIRATLRLIGRDGAVIFKENFYTHDFSRDSSLFAYTASGIPADSRTSSFLRFANIYNFPIEVVVHVAMDCARWPYRADKFNREAQLTYRLEPQSYRAYPILHSLRSLRYAEPENLCAVSLSVEASPLDSSGTRGVDSARLSPTLVTSAIEDFGGDWSLHSIRALEERFIHPPVELSGREEKISFRRVPGNY